jgi:hypothetical protein
LDEDDPRWTAGVSRLEKDRKSLWIALVLGLSEDLTPLFVFFEKGDVDDESVSDDLREAAREGLLLNLNEPFAEVFR